MTTGKKVALGILISVFVILVGLVIVIPLLIDIDRYRPQVVRHIQEETGKPAEIGKLTLHLFPTLAIRLDDFVLENPPGFPARPLLKVQRIDVLLVAGALWNRQVLINSLKLSDPDIDLLSDARGRWNFENAHAEKASRKVVNPAVAGAPPFTLGVISKVSISGGRIAAANLLSSGRPGPAFFEARGVSIELSDVDLNAFTASSSARLMTFPPLPSAPLGFAGLSSAAYAAPPASHVVAQGTLEADLLRFGNLQANAVKTRVRLFPKQVFFDGLGFELYGGRGSGDLSFDFAGRSPHYAANAHLAGVDMARLLAAFPEARGKMTGKMDGSMKLAGEVTHSPDPLAGVHGTGQMSIRNGQLPTLQLNKNLMLLARLSNLGAASGDPSSFSSITADLNIANQRVTSNKIAVVGNGVNIDGSGGFGLAGAGSLDYQGIAKLVAGQNPLAGFLQNLSGATYQDGKLSMPFTIGGTLQAPKFALKSGAGGGQLGGLQNFVGGAKTSTQQPGQGQQQSPADLARGISGLFKKKQPQQQPQQPPN